MKRVLTIAGLLTTALLATLVAAVALVVWSPLLTPVAHWVVPKLVRGVEFESIQIDGFLTITLKNARTFDEDGLLCARVDAAELKVTPKALLDKRIDVAQARLSGVSFDVRNSSSGELCILSLVPLSEPAPPSSEPSTPFSFAIVARDLTISDGALRIYGDPFAPPTIAFDIEHVALSGGFSDPMAFANIEGIDAFMLLAGKRVRAAVDGMATLMVPYSLGDAALSVHVEMDDYIADAGINAWFENASIAADVALSLAGIGPLDVSGVVTIEPELAISAAMRTRGLALAPLGIDGRALLRASVEMQGTPLSEGSHARAALDFRGSTFQKRRLDDARFEVAVDGEHWDLSRATLQSDGVVVSASGHGTLDSVHGRAHVSFAGRVPVPGVHAAIGSLSLDASADIDAKEQKIAARAALAEVAVENAVAVERLAFNVSARGGRRGALSAWVDATGVRVPQAEGFSANIHVTAKRDGTQASAQVRAVSKRGGALPADVSVQADVEAEVIGARALIPGFDQVLATAQGAVTAEAHRFMLQDDLPLSARVVAHLNEALTVEAGVFVPKKSGMPYEIIHLSAETPRSIIRDPSQFEWHLPVRAQLASRDVPLGLLSRAVDGLPTLEGKANINVTVAGTLRESKAVGLVSITGAQALGVAAKRLHLRVDADIEHPGEAPMPVRHARAALQIDGLSYGSVEAGELKLDALLEGSEAQATVLGRWPDGRDWMSARARVTGLPQLASAKLDATAAMRNFDVGIVKAFVPELQVKGKLALDAEAHGKLLAPDARAEVTLREGAVTYQSFPGVQDLALHATLSGTHVIVDQLDGKGAGGKGTLSANADVTLQQWAPKRARANVKLKNFAFSFAVLKDAKLSTEVDARLSFLEGITGRVQMAEGSLEVGGIGGGDREVVSIGSVPDVRFVEFDPLGQLSSQEGQHQAAERRTHMNITLQAKKIVVRNEKNILGVTADLRLQDSEDGVAPSGLIQVTDGRVEVLGRLYDIERARVALDGSSDIDPALDVRITRAFPNARVAVEVHGTAKEPKLVLASEPAIYERSQLLALVLTGREEAVSTSSSGPQQSNQATTEQVAGSVAAAVLGPLASSIGKKLGIDIVRVGVDRPSSQAARARKASVLGQNRASLELGKYLTDRLYVGARGVLGATDVENSYEARLEYGLTERLRLESVFGDRGVGGVDLMWRLIY